MGIKVWEGEVANRLRMGTKGRKAKWWKSKKLEQMSKRELIQTILVGKWQMVDPDTVPSLSRGQEVTESEYTGESANLSKNRADAPTPLPQLFHYLIEHSSFFSLPVRDSPSSASDPR